MPLQPSSSSRRKRTASALSWQAYGLQMGKFLRHGSSISASLAAMDAMVVTRPGWSHHVKEQLQNDTLGQSQAAASAVSRTSPSGHHCDLLPDKDIPFGHPGGTANQAKITSVQNACTRAFFLRFSRALKHECMHLCCVHCIRHQSIFMPPNPCSAPSAKRVASTCALTQSELRSVRLYDCKLSRVNCVYIATGAQAIGRGFSSKGVLSQPCVEL